MTPNGSSLYYGLPNGGYTYTSYYYSSNSGPYYNGYGTSTTSLTSRTLDTSVSSTSVSYPSASYSSTSAAYSYSPYQSNIGSYSDSYSNFTATNSATAPSKEYTHIFGTQSMYCSGSGTLINDSCLYSCTSGGGSNRTYTKAASNSTSNYCSNSGTSSFTYTLPEVSLLLNGYYQNEGTYYSPSEYTLAGAYNSVKNYYCKDIHSDQSVEYRQYYYCTSNCSGSSTGDTYYYATTSSCSDRWDYYVGEQTKAMGIRPVITIREK